MFIPEYNRKNEKQNYYSNLRLVISGSVFEFYEFSDPLEKLKQDLKSMILIIED